MADEIYATYDFKCFKFRFSEIYFLIDLTKSCTFIHLLKKLSLQILSLHPLCGGGDLLFLLSLPAAGSATAATCFCSPSKQKPLLGLFLNINSMHIGPGEFAC